MYNFWPITMRARGRTFGRHRVFQWWGKAPGRGPSRPGEARRADLLRARAEAPDPEHGALPGGLPAHHALLYGPPGTRQSSTVKAVLNEYAGRGLRLVEVKKRTSRSSPASSKTCAVAARGSWFSSTTSP